MNVSVLAGERGENSTSFTTRVASSFPVLMAVWLFLSVLGPHQELYKVFFHGIIIPAILVLTFSRKLNFSGTSSLLKIAVCFFTYAGITTFLVGLGPVDGHLRAFRWSVEATFCLLALWIWLPDVVRRPIWWARYLLLITFVASLMAIINFVFLENMQGRLSGFGGLHNPIHTGSVFIVFLAIAHFIMSGQVDQREARDRVLLLLTLVCVVMAVLLSESRGPVVAMMVYLPFLAILDFRSGFRRRNLLFSVLAIIIGAGTVVVIYGPETLIDQLLARGTSYRLDIWEGYLKYPPDSWLLGFGFGTESRYVPAVEAFWKPNGIPILHPHSVYVGTLVETGLIGVAFLLLMVGLVLKSIYYAPRPTQEKMHLLGMLGLVFILTLTVGQGVISSIKMLWLFFWFPIAFVWVWTKMSSEQADR